MIPENTVLIPKACLPYIMVDVGGIGLSFGDLLESKVGKVRRMLRTKNGWIEISPMSATEENPRENA